MSLFGVFSNYNHLPPEQLLDYVDDFILLDQSDNENISERLRILYGHRFARSAHVGHNLLDFLEFIELNYSKLPERLLLGKGNMVPRHLSFQDMELAISQSEKSVVPLFSKESVTEKIGVAVLRGDWYLEKNNDWFANLKRHRYFTSVDAMGEFLFENWSSPEYIPFSPGACYLVSRSTIQAVPLETFRCLGEILKYDFFPSEAWMVERILGGVLTGEYRLRKEWLNVESFVAALSELPDRTNLKVSGAGPLKPFKDSWFGLIWHLARKEQA